MAAVLYPEGKSREDFQEEFLTCSICAEPYDSGSHQAKCLPCLHTYCKVCLQSVAGKRTELDCPNCRKLVKLPGGTVESLPNNFIVENLREYQNIFNLQVQCGNCDDDNPAVRFCHDCGLFLCHDCTDGHYKMRSMRHHHVVTIEELQSKKCNPMMQQKPCCKKHPKQELNMYCKNKDCNIPVCATCGLVDHKNHDLVHLDAAIDQIIKSMRRSSARVNDKRIALNETSAKLEAAESTLSKHFSHVQKNIKEIEQELTDLIKNQCDKARRRVAEMCEEEGSRLLENKQYLDELVTQMKSACEFADQSCDMSHTTQIISSQKQIMDRLNELEKAALPDTSSNKTDFVFTAEHQSAATKIKDSLQNLCDINWKPQLDPQQCTIRLNVDGKNRGNRGNQKLAVIQAVNKKGHKIPRSGNHDDIMIMQGDDRLHLEDNNNGTYSCCYQSSHNSKPLNVTINGDAIRGSPFKTVPQVDPHRCIVELGKPGLSAETRTAIIQTVDTNGCKMNFGGGKINATQGRNHVNVVDHNDGTYKLTYQAAGRSGQLNIKIGDDPIKGSPFNTVPQVDPQKCSIQLGLNVQSLRSSQRSYGPYNQRKAFIQTVDTYGAKMTFGHAKIEATIRGQVLNVQDNNDGTYEFDYNINHDYNQVGWYVGPADHSLHVSINGVALPGSPFQM